MRLVIETDVSQRRGGMAAISEQTGLAGHGYDQDAALVDLRRALDVWVIGLMAAGRLPQALANCDIRCEDRESEGVVIDLRVA